MDRGRVMAERNHDRGRGQRTLLTLSPPVSASSSVASIASSRLRDG